MQSKRYKNLPEKTKELQSDSINNILGKIKTNCTTKFDESIDLSFRINNKQKKNEINLRTVVNMPGGTGKLVKVAVVCEESKKEEAKKANADIITIGPDLYLKSKKFGYSPIKYSRDTVKGFLVDAKKSNFKI